MAVAVAVAVAVSGGGAVAVAGLTKRFFNHIQKDFLINVWVYFDSSLAQCLFVMFVWIAWIQHGHDSDIQQAVDKETDRTSEARAME